VTAQRGLALLFITGTLVVLAEFESTAGAAQALAVLIMTSVLLLYGERAINTVRTLTGAGPAQKG